MQLLRNLLIITVFLHPSLVNSDVKQSLTVSADIATEGYITLSWKKKENLQSPFQLQVATDPSFSSLLRNLTLQEQEKVHLSGFTDGAYYVRLLDDQHQILTNKVEFQVKHRDLQSAWLLFATGLTLFIALLVSIYRFTYHSE